MNYEELKYSIQEAIRKNGQGLITGDLLQAKLLEMINSLGEGYQFMGVITPEDDDIPEGDNKVFYIALEGDYGALGFVVPKGNIGIFTLGDSWDYELVPIGVSAIEVTWSELVALRNGGKLIGGAKYRITDYECTTTTSDTKSANHPFDIIVEALDDHTLSEDAKAIKSNRDAAYIVEEIGSRYELTSIRRKVFTNSGIIDAYFWKPTESVSKDYIGFYTDNPLEQILANKNSSRWIRADENASIVQGVLYPREDHWQSWHDMHLVKVFDYYFAKANLSAWNLKYCLDNDTEKFAWAANTIVWGSGTIRMPRMKSADTTHNGVKYFAWWNEDDGEPNYTLHENPSIGEEFYDVDFAPVSEVEECFFGKGVIYYMKDEWGNECPYDFKNIMYLKKLTDGKYDPINGNDTWVYTFNAWNDNDGIIEDATIANGIHIDDSTNACYGNIIKPYRYDYDGKDALIYRLNDIVFLNIYDEDDYYECYHNVFGYNCDRNIFGNDSNSNVIGNNVAVIEASHGFIGNEIGDLCDYLDFGTSCLYNRIGAGCVRHKFGNSCYSNTVGNNCADNTFGNGCDYNVIGSDNHNHIFDVNCKFNRIENGCSYLSLSANAKHNVVGTGSYDVNIDGVDNNIGSECHDVKVSGHNTIGDSCVSINLTPSQGYHTIGSNCSNIKLILCQGVTIGAECKAITLQKVSLSRIESGTDYLTISSTQPINHIWVAGGLEGSQTTPLVIEGLVPNVNYPQFVGRNTNGDVVIKNPMD